MTDVLGKVLSAFVASSVLVPSALRKDRHTAGVEIGCPKDEGVFMKDVVQLYVAHTSMTVTVGNERVVFIEGCARLAQCRVAHEVVHAAYEVRPASAPVPEIAGREWAPLLGLRCFSGSGCCDLAVPRHLGPLLRCLSAWVSACGE
jgi:hypothetical protein